MDKNTATKPASVAQTISLLMEISRLDTLHRDLYFQRAHQLMEPMLSQSAYAQMKEGLASIASLESQLRAAIERGDWLRSLELTARIRGIREGAETNGDWMKCGEALYDRIADVPIDPFSPGLHVFAGGSEQRLQERQDRAIEILSTLKRIDETRKDFYVRRESDFEALSIKAPVDKREKKPTTASPTQLQRQALEALDAGNLSGLDQVIAKLMEKPVEQEAEQVSDGVGPAELAELGNDLVCSFSDATLAGASRLGLVSARIASRRSLADLIPQGWQPAFLRDEVKLNAKKQVERLTYPSGTTDHEKEAIQFFLLNPFITSGGTRYQGCFVTEDLLIEDFPEPEPKEKVPPAGLLSSLKLESRWGLTRIEIENALLQHGPRILEEALSLDPEAFRLVAIPPDTYIYFAPLRGWGQKQIWTHFDGYRVSEDGKLQAIAGGDERFGGAYDVVPFSPAYTNEKVLARFVVVQKKRMMSWHRK